jgi:hypothetical protein|tara:strand:- start:1200 stop:1370 length:171 start_codon:yes stop_codon:yes gene_type:complete
MEFKVHATNSDYESWTVREFLEHELNAVRELHAEKPNDLYPAVIEYLEKRLDGTIQ